MARVLKVEIQESVEYLEKSLHNARTASRKERLPMLWWLKSGQVKQHQALAERLGCNPLIMTRWLQQYRQEGLSGLLMVKHSLGRPRALNDALLAQLEARLEQPEGCKSYIEIAQWAQTTLGKPVNYKTVHKTVRYRLQAKLKVPRPQSIKQDPEAVRLFKTTFPLPC